MKLEDIDHLFDIMVREAAEAGDESLLPGAVILGADTYIGMETGGRMTCTKILDGIRYRNIRVNVARPYEDKVLNRAEAGDQGKPYGALEPLA